MIVCISGYSQKKSKFEKYDEFVWNAMIQFKNKDYENSLKNFKKAFKVIPNEYENDYFYAAAAALHLNKEIESERLIVESIKEMNTSKTYFLNFKEFDPFRSKKLFEKILDKYGKYQSIFFKNLSNPKIYKEIDSLLLEDQKVRLNGGDIINIDTQNINRLIEITKKYGWQGRGGWTVLWHHRGEYGQNERTYANKNMIDSLIAVGKIPKDFWTSNEVEKWERDKNNIWSFFKPYIDAQIAKDKMRKKFWARFEDEKSIMIKKTQIYGTFWSQLEEFPIEDIENVDKRRSLVGMPPLWYISKTCEFKLPDGYKPTIDYDVRNNWYNFLKK
jgi:tetratricopeptide (TPR) repeat protein